MADTNDIARSLSGLFSFTHPGFGFKDTHADRDIDERFQQGSSCPQHNRRSIARCTSDRKAMLLNTVVFGKGYKITVNKTILAEPPARYDSVSVVVS